MSMDMEFPVPDFEGAAQTQAMQREAIRRAADQGRLAPDIAAAMTSPEAGDWLASHGFEVVAALDDLEGPFSGLVEVPARLADRELSGHADLDNAWQRLQLYRRLLLTGTAEQQRRLLNRELLQQMWPQRIGPPPLLRTWENRFPQLRSPLSP
ncbi:hypothetical protein [Streptomyces sp. S1D4-20]|uniref:hypothetical protein n=1 Tax=Streptomyces sp. S1D4-20 TaxID=2594462 RepID=UPI0011659C28|nr:hypothetical protein [Streptomyces sp. S1D4-20]QDN54018.1 hypothetical protein FNV67_00075 [Streptomyces sp. S1D4-20]